MLCLSKEMHHKGVLFAFDKWNLSRSNRSRIMNKLNGGGGNGEHFPGYYLA